MGDIEYPERLTRPIKRSQWTTEGGLAQLTLNQEVQKRIFAEGVARDRSERIATLEAQIAEMETTPALVEIRRSQLEPGKTGQHTNGPASFWVRFGTEPWRRFKAYRNEHKLTRNLRELLEVEEE